jgi:hypothetical protein
VVVEGLLTRKQLRSSSWRRLRQDVYADVALAVTHRLMVSAVGLTLLEGAGFTGRSGATLWGVKDVATVTDPVEVLVPAGPRQGRWPCTSRVDTADRGGDAASRTSRGPGASPARAAPGG